ncbi:hypothetical protein BV25DRAFT_1841367 [Artomyces pyxidatus]|uniref:Uncharacterized protein n=1 Tax=Artomyces pyxidatus TaxID=48021 RepID=A0ACB8SPB1_9AGAM|nr:hypothetical protein BV25DRAFT_1841367 [Artomyces pyxidatus]
MPELHHSDSDVLHAYLLRITTTRRAVMQYDPARRALGIWYWPINETGERIDPAHLQDYRRSHAMRGPCCLCPLTQSSGNSAIQSACEAAMYVKIVGRNTGEYVASCAQGLCDYYIPLEKFYGRRMLAVKRYCLRRSTNGGQRGPPLVSRTESARRRELLTGMDKILSCVESDGLQPNMCNTGDNLGTIIPAYRPQPRPAATITELLFRLDAAGSPGLTDQQLQELFRRCHECGLTMTVRMAVSHNCPDLLYASSDAHSTQYESETLSIALPPFDTQSLIRCVGMHLCIATAACSGVREQVEVSESWLETRRQAGMPARRHYAAVNRRGRNYKHRTSNGTANVPIPDSDRSQFLQVNGRITARRSCYSHCLPSAGHEYIRFL